MQAVAKSQKIKKSTSTKVFYVICYTFVALMALVCLLPFIMVVSGSFSSEQAIRFQGYGILPREFTTAAYALIFKSPMTVVRAYGVSIFITLAGTAVGLLLTTMTAYVISRKDFKYRNALSFFFYFTTLFNGGMVCSYIFYIQYLENYLGTGLPQHALSAKDGGWSLVNPAADLYESYEFKDGTPFSYDDPRYDPSNLGKDRDPRLDYTIYYNGAIFMGTEYKMSPDYSAAKKEKLDYTSEASRTGFMMRKYFEESTPINDVQSANGLTPIIRYAEVLLGYLECLVEDNQTITQGTLDETINAVRGRASVKMPVITEVNPAKLREIVRHERRIELAMEGIRYWDIMRWGIAHEVLSQKIWGAPYPNSTQYATTTKEVDPTGKCRWYVGKRAFRNPTDYTWPIPQSEQNINLRD